MGHGFVSLPFFEVTEAGTDHALVLAALLVGP
jgi:heme-degrading monooxygenase HmoA